VSWRAAAFAHFVGGSGKAFSPWERIVMKEETRMTEKQKAVLEASDLELLDEMKDGHLLVRDTEAMAIRGVYFCYIMSLDGSIQNIDYHYRTRQAAKSA
jgi:hypothetical protein